MREECGQIGHPPDRPHTLGSSAELGAAVNCGAAAPAVAQPVEAEDPRWA